MLNDQASLRYGLRGRRWLSATILLFSVVAFVHAQDVAESQIEKEINIKANELQLGKPLSGVRRTEVPVRKTGWGLPRMPVWLQEFAGGRVYWMAHLRARGVHGDILKRWGAEGGEQGFGFPLGDEQRCDIRGEGYRVQVFEAGAIRWRAATRETTIHRVQSAGDYFSLPACGSAMPAAVDDSGRFRVILTGFTVNRQTNDHILEADGKGDEVYILAEVAQYDGVWSLAGQVWTERERSGLPVLSARGPITQRRSLASVLMGDANNQEAPRMRAGTAGDMGGFRTGDRFPTNEPWRLTGTPSANRPPLLLWEGDLRRGNDLVIIIPTIWEWDGGNIQPREQFAQDIKRYFNETVYREGSYQEEQFRYSLTGADVAGAGDRPIGWLGRTPGIRLDFEKAVSSLVDGTTKYGPGVVELNYASETEDYSLYLKIERLRSGSLRVIVCYEASRKAR